MEGDAVMIIDIGSSDRNLCSTKISPEIATNNTNPSWKLYDNPFYNPRYHHHQKQGGDRRDLRICSHNHHHLQNFHLLSSSSIWDLTLMKAIMETEVDIARTQIIELQAELEYERKARKRAEAMNKRLARELAEERRGREAAERVCEQLASEVSSDRSEIDNMRKEIEEEREMLRVAEVLREERVQMKLADAKLFLEQRLLEFEGPISEKNGNSVSNPKEVKPTQKDDGARQLERNSSSPASLSGRFARMVLGERNNGSGETVVSDSREEKRLILKSVSCNENANSQFSSAGMQRRVSPEPENPHIKRGIKGFVEFPRVVRAIRSRSEHWSTKLECQKAQLKILLKRTSPVRSNSPV